MRRHHDYVLSPIVIIKIAFIALAIILQAGPAKSETREFMGVALSGNFTQGGHLIGKALPGFAFTFNARRLRIDDAGQFVFGFHRDASTPQTLTLITPKGKKVAWAITIAQRTYDIQAIDGLPPAKVTPPKSVLARIKNDNQLVKQARLFNSPLPYFKQEFIWPSKGVITGVYGSQRILNGLPKRPHYGIDIAAPTGTAVRAPAGGIIRLATDLYYSGGTLILDHGHGLSSAFLHLDQLKVAVGTRVEQGEILATIGATGRVTGPHLDWRINWFDTRLDPAFLVPPH